MRSTLTFQDPVALSLRSATHKITNAAPSTPWGEYCDAITPLNLSLSPSRPHNACKSFKIPGSRLMLQDDRDLTWMWSSEMLYTVLVKYKNTPRFNVINLTGGLLWVQWPLAPVWSTLIWYICDTCCCCASSNTDTLCLTSYIKPKYLSIYL